MADKQEKPKTETDSLLFRDIDPKLQEKVDSYMGLNYKSAPKTAEPAQPSQTPGAPLLPTDKLPESIAKATKEVSVPEDKPVQPKPAEPKSPEPTVKLTSNQLTVDKLDNPSTNKAVDEIMAEEADQLLEHEDKKLARVNHAPSKTSFSSRLKQFFTGKKLVKKLVIFLLIVVIVLGAVPATRYMILNGLGVRASMSMQIVDSSTDQPLKNVVVSISGQSSETEKDGSVRLSGIKLGKQTLTIKKPAFAETNREVTVGWGSNPLGKTGINSVGAQYKFSVVDYLSDKPIFGAEAESKEASATSNKQGELVLVIDKTDDGEREVKINANGYRQETIKVSPDNQDQRKIILVPSRKQAFVSKRSGTLDLYKIDVDGKNEKKILSGSGNEREDEIVLAHHPTDGVVAYVSIVGTNRGRGGDLLATLQVIDLSSDKRQEVIDSEFIQVVDWLGDKLIYIRTAEDKSTDDPARHRLMSYDYKTNSSTELASANYFNDVSVAKGVIYYSPAKVNDGDKAGFYSINSDGSGRFTIANKEAWSIVRTAYSTLSVSLGEKWQSLDLSSGALTKSEGAPPSLRSRIYYDSPDKSRSLWSEPRDGKGTLLVFDQQKNKDNVVLTKSGLKNPLRWLDNSHVVFRVDNGQEIADYVLSLDGGEPKKISDVTNVNGIDRWYFF